MLRRISNQDGDSAPSTSGADAARRGETRRSNEAETRERAAKFRAALGREGSEAAAERGQLQAAAKDRAEGRAEERGRDRAAAADVLSRMGLHGDGDGPEGRQELGSTGGRQGAQSAGGRQASGAQGDQPAQAAGPEGSKLQGAHGPNESGAAGASEVELGPEVQAIEDAIQKVMDQPEGGSELGGTPPADAFAVPGATPWARPEGPARPEAPRQLPSPAPGAELYHKLLMGQGPAGAEARLSITQGPLAGLQIHLTNGPGGVQAAVLTQGGSSRQTLVSAMDQVAQRLRQKGHNLDIRFGGPTGQPGAGQTPRRG